MKEYVDIIGSGENVTELKGSISSGDIGFTSAIVTLTHNATLSDLTVKNTGGNIYSIGVYGGGINACRLENVTVTALGASKNYGIYSNLYVRMTNISITVSGGTSGRGIHIAPLSQTFLTDVVITVVDTENATGIFKDIASSTMNDVTIKVIGGSYSCGVYNTGSPSSLTMSNISVTASGEAEAHSVYGLRNTEWASSTLTNSSIIASGGIVSYGVFNSSDSSSSIRRSTLSGDTYGLMQSTDYNFGGVVISQSTIKNGVSGSGRKSCVACDNGAGGSLATDCN